MIYSLNQKEMKNKMIEFNKTIYGKSIFIICYSLFFILFLSVIISFIFNLLCYEYFIILLILCLISFLIGSYTFYKEFRIFVNSKNKSS